VVEGERLLRLDDGEYFIKPGDVAGQLGNRHGCSWGRRGRRRARRGLYVA